LGQKTNLDYYNELLDEIEVHFGADWLRGEAEDARSGHWVPRAWASGRDVLLKANQTKALGFSEEHAAVFELASWLRIASLLPNFSAAITLSRLRNPLEIDGVAYEVHVAALSTGCAESVRFVPRSSTPGVRTPDLELTLSGVEAQVECKRRDKYQRATDTGVLWGAIESALASVHDKLSTDYEVIVCAADDLDGTAITSVASWVRDIVQRGDEGIFSGGADGCALLVRKSPPRPPGLQGVFIPANLNPARATVKVRMGSDGTLSSGPMLRISLYTFEAHRLGQIILSFDSARDQLARGGNGLIYIDVDASNVPDLDRGLYFLALQSGIQRQFAPKKNTRVAAVVVTAGPDAMEVVDRGFLLTYHTIMTVRNPYHSASAGLRFPGEPHSGSAFGRYVALDRPRRVAAP
jgi:hypothetical protein